MFASGSVHLCAVNSSITQDTLRLFSQRSSTLGQGVLIDVGCKPGRISINEMGRNLV